MMGSECLTGSCLSRSVLLSSTWLIDEWTDCWMDRIVGYTGDGTTNSDDCQGGYSHIIERSLLSHCSCKSCTSLLFSLPSLPSLDFFFFRFFFVCWFCMCIYVCARVWLLVWDVNVDVDIVCVLCCAVMWCVRVRFMGNMTRPRLPPETLACPTLCFPGTLPQPRPKVNGIGVSECMCISVCYVDVCARVYVYVYMCMYVCVLTLEASRFNSITSNVYVLPPPTPPLVSLYRYISFDLLFLVLDPKDTDIDRAIADHVRVSRAFSLSLFFSFCSSWCICYYFVVDWATLHRLANPSSPSPSHLPFTRISLLSKIFFVHLVCTGFEIIWSPRRKLMP